MKYTVQMLAELASRNYKYDNEANRERLAAKANFSLDIIESYWQTYYRDMIFPQYFDSLVFGFPYLGDSAEGLHCLCKARYLLNPHMVAADDSIFYTDAVHKIFRQAIDVKFRYTDLSTTFDSAALSSVWQPEFFSPYYMPGSAKEEPMNAENMTKYVLFLKEFIETFDHFKPQPQKYSLIDTII